MKGDVLKYEIGETYMLTKNGNHGYMMAKGFLYTLLDYNDNMKCPFIFTSDYGDSVPYGITAKTFENDMVLCTPEDACSITMVF